MKYGVHAYIFTDRWSDSQLGILDTAKELGFDGIEIGVGDDVPFTPALTRQRAEALDLELFVGPGGLWPAECDLSADDLADRQRGLAWHQKQVDVAGEMGATLYSGALYGHPGVVKRRLPPADEYPRTAEGLHELAAHAQRRGVTIALEPMSRFRTHLVNTPEQVMRLVTLADHPNLSVLLDTYHMVSEVRDYGQAICTVRERLWGLHACENDRGLPGGGLVPWEAIFATLKETAFDGYLLLETYNTSLGDFAYRRGLFQDLCPDGNAFARQGLAFLRERGLGIRMRD
jgi:D-psicose/D-tagatose/L-ribulose 3-epimerase